MATARNGDRVALICESLTSESSLQVFFADFYLTSSLGIINFYVHVSINLNNN